MRKRVAASLCILLLALLPLFSTTLTYHSVNQEDKEILLGVDWDLGLFGKSSEGYDSQLAKAAIVLAREIYVSPEALEDAVGKLGYSNLWIDEEENNFISNLVVAFAHQRHQDTNYFLIVARGTASVFDFLTDIVAIFDYFRESQENTMERFRWYLRNQLGMDEEKLKGEKNVFFVTGHSMGASVANLMSLSLEEFADKEDIYAYCFSCPSLGVEDGEGITNALNIISDNDPVTLVPRPVGRYGRDIVFSPESVSHIIYNVVAGKYLWDICGFTIINKWENHRLDVYLSYVISRSYGILED